MPNNISSSTRRPSFSQGGVFCFISFGPPGQNYESWIPVDTNVGTRLDSFGSSVKHRYASMLATKHGSWRKRSNNVNPSCMSSLVACHFGLGLGNCGNIAPVSRSGFGCWLLKAQGHVTMELLIYEVRTWQVAYNMFYLFRRKFGSLEYGSLDWRVLAFAVCLEGTERCMTISCFKYNAV